MESVPGVTLLAGLLGSSLGLGADLSVVVAAAVIVVGSLAVAAVVAMTLLDQADASGSGGAGRATRGKGSVVTPAPAGTPTVVLLGPSGAGKTALFHRMCTGNLPRTVTSLAVSSAAATLTAIPEGDGEEHSADVRIVDIPGNPRAKGRDEAMALLGHADTGLVVVVVDASSVDSVRKGAGELAELLTSRAFVEASKPVAVIGTRGEARGSGDAASLRAAVEAELDNVRRSTGTLGAVAADEEAETGADDRLALGSATETFSLAEHSPLAEPVRFAVVSCKEETGARAAQRAACRIVVAAVGGA